MTIKIKNRITGEIIVSGEYRSVRDALAKNKEVDFSNATLLDADLYHADLDGVILAGANLAGANLDGASLRSANLFRADLGGADLQGAKLIHTNMAEVNLRGADLEGANLRGANLYHASLHRANLNHTCLHHTEMTGACLQGATVEHVNYRDTILYGVTGLPGDLIFISGSIPDAIRINTIGQAYVRIGDIKRTKEEWLSMSEQDVSQMGFCKKWIPRYMEIVRALG